MKLRLTTPASPSSRKSSGKLLGFLSKTFIVFAIVAGLVLGSLPLLKPASADQFDDKIASLQADMARYQAEANRLNAEAATLSNALAQVTNERNAIQAQVDLSQEQYNKLVVEIADTEKQIKENQDALGSTIADLYVDGTVTPLELLASSENISDFMNRQEYRNSIRDQLSSTINKVTELKQKLDQQKSDVEKVLNEQKIARDALQAKVSEQSNLLSRTKNDEATYQNMIRSSAQQIAEAKALQAAIQARINGSGGYVLVQSGAASGYPWNNSTCPMQGYYSTGGADGNGGDGMGYGCRQCTSYVAWRLGQETGYYPTNWGDAKFFTNKAKQSPWNGVEGAPRAGAIAVMDPASAGQQHGHVAYVEAVSGNNVTVSQYNYNYGSGYGMYSMMTLNASAFDHYVYIP